MSLHVEVLPHGRCRGLNRRRRERGSRHNRAERRASAGRKADGRRITLRKMLLALETVTRRGSIAVEMAGKVEAMIGDESPVHGERLPAAIIAFLGRFG